MNLDELTIEEVRAIQITDIRARLAARTPGSWLATLDNDGWCVNAVLDEGTPKERMETLARLRSGASTSDACFIASAADDIGVLLAEVDRLTAERDEAMGWRDEWEAFKAHVYEVQTSAFRRGAEAMREAAVEVARKRADLPVTSDTDAAWCRSSQCIVDELRDLPVPEDKL
jgi:hypothetical protein